MWGVPDIYATIDALRVDNRIYLALVLRAIQQFDPFVAMYVYACGIRGYYKLVAMSVIRVVFAAKQLKLRVGQPRGRGRNSGDGNWGDDNDARHRTDAI